MIMYDTRAHACTYAQTHEHARVQLYRYVNDRNKRMHIHLYVHADIQMQTHAGAGPYSVGMKGYTANGTCRPSDRHCSMHAIC